MLVVLTLNESFDRNFGMSEYRYIVLSYRNFDMSYYNIGISIYLIAASKLICPPSPGISVFFLYADTAVNESLSFDVHVNDRNRTIIDSLFLCIGIVYIHIISYISNSILVRCPTLQKPRDMPSKGKRAPSRKYTRYIIPYTSNEAECFPHQNLL